MRKLAFCAAAAACLGMAAPAMASDMYDGSMKDAPAPMPVATWTGFYIGAGVGAGAVVHELDVNAFGDYYADKCGELDHVIPTESFSNLRSIELEKPYIPVYEMDHCGGSEASLNFDGIGGEGLFGTVQVGYDWQFKPRAVFGFFADADFTNISTDLDFSASGTELLRPRNGEATSYVNGPSRGEITGDGEVDLNWMWTIGARLGFLPTPDTLVYILAGYSQAEFDDPSLTINWGGGSETVSTSLDTFSGVTVGAGMETRLNHNWGLKLEYRFTQLQDEELFSWSDSWGDCGCWAYEAGVSADLEPSIHTGRVALTYKFNRAPEPVEYYK